MAAVQRVDVHYHGCLVDHASGMHTAERLYTTYDAAGAYPVFFVWSSGLLEVLRGNLPEILNESVFKSVQKWVTKYAIGKIGQPMGVRGIGGLMTPRDLDVNLELAKRERSDEPYGHVS